MNLFMNLLNCMLKKIYLNLNKILFLIILNILIKKKIIIIIIFKINILLLLFLNGQT
jgi:hypothetical protein